jgi:hypothetical protein
MSDFDYIDSTIDRLRFDLEDCRVKHNVAFLLAKQALPNDEAEKNRLEEWKDAVVVEHHKKTVELERLMALKILERTKDLDVAPYRKELLEIMRREKFGVGRPQTEADLDKFAKNIDSRLAFHGWEDKPDGETYPEFSVKLPRQENINLIRNVNMLARILKPEDKDYAYLVIDRDKSQVSQKTKPCLKIHGEFMEQANIRNFRMLESVLLGNRQIWTLRYAMNEAATKNQL